MKIKTGTEIEVTFYADIIQDVDSSVLMDQIMDLLKELRVSNPSYREIKKQSKVGARIVFGEDTFNQAMSKKHKGGE